MSRQRLGSVDMDENMASSVEISTDSEIEVVRGPDAPTNVFDTSHNKHMYMNIIQSGGFLWVGPKTSLPRLWASMHDKTFTALPKDYDAAKAVILGHLADFSDDVKSRWLLLFLRRYFMYG